MIIRVTDVETCGFPPDNAQIVEVATFDLDSDSCTRGRVWSSLVNPGRPIPPEASAVHHITDDMVKDAPLIVDLIPVITEPGDAYPMVYAAHNRKFEKDCLQLAGLDIGEGICTYKCGVLLFPDCPNHKNQTLRYFLGLKLADPSLAQPHRALGDAYVTAALLRNYLRVASPEKMIEASGGPITLPRLTFGEHAMKPIEAVPTSYFEWIVKKAREGAEWGEDVLYTAQHQIADRRLAQRQRSPV